MRNRISRRGTAALLAGLAVSQTGCGLMGHRRVPPDPAFGRPPNTADFGSSPQASPFQGSDSALAPYQGLGLGAGDRSGYGATPEPPPLLGGAPLDGSAIERK